MRIGIDKLTSNKSSEFGRDFQVNAGPDIYAGRLGAFCVGDVSELYLVTSLPEVYSSVTSQTPEDLKTLLDDETACATKVFDFLQRIINVAEL